MSPGSSVVAKKTAKETITKVITAMSNLLSTRDRTRLFTRVSLSAFEIGSDPKMPGAQPSAVAAP